MEIGKALQAAGKYYCDGSYFGHKGILGNGEVNDFGRLAQAVNNNPVTKYLNFGLCADKK